MLNRYRCLQDSEISFLSWSYTIEIVEEKNLVAVNAEVIAWFSDNSNNTRVVIYNTVGLAVRHHRRCGASIGLAGERTVRETSAAFSVTTSSMTMEIMAVTRAFRRLESEDYTITLMYAC